MHGDAIYVEAIKQYAILVESGDRDQDAKDWRKKVIIAFSSDGITWSEWKEVYTDGKAGDAMYPSLMSYGSDNEVAGSTFAAVYDYSPCSPRRKCAMFKAVNVTVSVPETKQSIATPSEPSEPAPFTPVWTIANSSDMPAKCNQPDFPNFPTCVGALPGSSVRGPGKVANAADCCAACAANPDCGGWMMNELNEPNRCVLKGHDVKPRFACRTPPCKNCHKMGCMPCDYR